MVISNSLVSLSTFDVIDYYELFSGNSNWCVVSELHNWQRDGI